ncbi:MAG: glycosyltransferase [Candidatus Aureabacteria bacterium]|nr:glycosyltransferase [Candidatus Auribacterota bacterium]
MLNSSDPCPFSSHLVSLICPTFNGLTLMKETLPVLLRILSSLSLKTELIVVDNGSTDGTEGFVRGQRFPIQYVRLEENKGFAVACNEGVKRSSGTFLFFINNDILAEGDFLTPLLRLYERNPNVFAVVPRLMRWDRKTIDDGIRNPVFSTGLLDVRLEEDKMNAPAPTVFFCGGAFLVLKEHFLNLGGFDEIYTPFAWEDLDLGYQAVQRGFYNLYTPQITLYHKREATSRSIYTQTEFKTLVWRNKFIFMWSRFHDKEILFQHFLYLPWKLLKFIFNGRWPYVLGFIKALSYLKRIIKKRSIERPYVKMRDSQIISGTWKQGIEIAI